MKTIDLDNLFCADDFKGSILSGDGGMYDPGDGQACADAANRRFREIVKENGIRVYGYGQDGCWEQYQLEGDAYEGVLFVTKELTSDTKSHEVEHHPV